VLLIGDEKFNVENQIHVIANKILFKCKISNEKNENNNKRLKSRQGKLMITNGMSIDEFEKKIGYKPIKY